jgi:uncharacterized protein
MFTDRRANSHSTRRVKQPWPSEKPFKMLALDGGGIRGIYTAELLRLCEKAFCGDRGIAQFFDMVTGTSTGGIIALGLGLGMKMDDIVGFYRDDGRRIFPPLPATRWRKCLRFLAWLQKSKLDHAELERALKARFGEHLLGESVTRLVVPAFMMPKTEIAVFKTDHHMDFKRDHLTPMWQVARATSAAPTYLQGFEHEASGTIFLDGGVWANNPVMVALVDALTDYDIGFDQVEILSIGTGNAPFTLSRAQIFSGLLAWKEVISAAMFLTTDNATAQAKLLLGPDKCVRIEPTKVDGEIDLDDYDSAFRVLPKRAEEHFADHHDELKRFFQDVASPRERHYSKGS